jgi:cell division protein FtsL
MKVILFLLLVTVVILAVAHVVSEIRGLAMDRATTAQERKNRERVTEELL